ncbi:hypothetical protein [Candidatus Thiosymbion oneisti]|uniref:hypothetical protein n=1 Tax=Candidatus Thiosymbion oneisti TaxID=589554 RepID=UPI000B7CCECA|nr:hypothetical protein [Candidatus Thiosymbion oneisti]
MGNGRQHEPQVFLYDGLEDKNKSRADGRLKWFRNGRANRIAHGLNSKGDICQSGPAIVKSIKNLYSSADASLVFVHTSACAPDYLAGEVKKWGECPSQNLAVVLYSGAGVGAELAKPMLAENVTQKLAYVGHLEVGIDSSANANDVAALIDHFIDNADQLNSGGGRVSFLEELSRLVDQVNRPFRSQSTSLHIALSAYLAAQGIDPRTGEPLVGSDLVAKLAREEMVDKMKKPRNWMPFLVGPVEHVGDKLKTEGISLGPELREFCAFLGGGAMPANESLVVVWKELDRVVSC